MRQHRSDFPDNHYYLEVESETRGRWGWCKEQLRYIFCNRSRWKCGIRFARCTYRHATFVRGLFGENEEPESACVGDAPVIFQRTSDMTRDSLSVAYMIFGSMTGLVVYRLLVSISHGLPPLNRVVKLGACSQNAMNFEDLPDFDISSDSDTKSDWDDPLIPLIFNPCSQYDIDDVVNACRRCGRFCVKCCLHETRTCHHCRLVFTDGSCLNNGAHGSASGIGIAFGRPEGEPGTGRSYQFSIPVNDRLDPEGKRTNQRAELLAALHGLKKICRFDDGYLMRKMEKVGVDYLNPDSAEIVIATDSEYVVKGVTEWLPRWRVRIRVK